jgi:hypothetical protein
LIQCRDINVSVSCSQYNRQRAGYRDTLNAIEKVDPDSAGVFGFVPLIVRDNGKF